MMEVDFLIIGHGLAGALCTHELQKLGKSVCVVDRNESTTSSKIAAGMFTPVNPKRATVSWNFEAYHAQAMSAYSEMEKQYKSLLVHHLPIVHAFGNAKEANDFSARCDNRYLMQYCDPQISAYPFIHSPYGLVGIHSSGWVDVVQLLSLQLRQLIQSDQFYSTPLDWSELKANEDGTWVYKQIRATHVICCEGHSRTINPYWNFLPFHQTYGDVLLIMCEQLPETHIWKKGIYLVPLGNKVFKVGATYKRMQSYGEIPIEGTSELIEKLNAMLRIPYQVMEHACAIRPTTPDRKPIVGKHPAFKHLYILNGLGTKGVLYAPAVAKALVKHILHQETLPADISIERYIK